jgi:cysteine desulfurase/selenocysteine lyase
MLESLSASVERLPISVSPALNLRAQFPIFNGQPTVVFLDSAATTQKPASVLAAEKKYYETACANSGRGTYKWAFESNELVDSARTTVADFLGAASDSEIVFTSGSTMSLNLVALSWGETNLRDGDEILFCPADHRSMNDPWVLLQERLIKQGVGIKLVAYELTSSGGIDLEHLQKLITHRTRLVNITHINNVAGVINDLGSIRKAIPESVLINLDIAQSVSHTVVHVSEIGADFVSFSGHKSFAAPGIGVLYVNKDLHSQLRRVFVGGGQNNWSDSHSLSMPQLLECGTLNMVGIVSLKAAIDFINSIGRNEIHSRLADLTQILYKKLADLSLMEFLYLTKPYHLKDKYGLFSFNVRGYSPAEVGDYLADKDICVRYGDHCTGSALSSRPHNDSVRVSLSIYNTEEDIELLCQALSLLPERTG